MADALSRIHHPASATPVATINMNTMDLQIIGSEEWKQEVRELLVEDAYSRSNCRCPPRWEAGEITDEADNRQAISEFEREAPSEKHRAGAAISA